MSASSAKRSDAFARKVANLWSITQQKAKAAGGRAVRMVDRLDTPGDGRLPHERDFLPAALEIIETPASPLGRTIMAVIMALVLVAFLWAFFGKVDIIATATGRIIPSGQVKVIQPF